MIFDRIFRSSLFAFSSCLLAGASSVNKREFIYEHNGFLSRYTFKQPKAKRKEC